MIENEVLLKLSYEGVFALRDLVQRRLDVFFGSVKIFLLPSILQITCNYDWVTMHVNRLKKMPPGRSPGIHLPRFQVMPILSIEDHLRCSAILAKLNFSTLKHGSFANDLSKLQKGYSALEKSPPTMLSSLNKPLNTYVDSPNAPRIYHQLFKVYFAYRNVVLDALTKLPEFLNQKLSIREVSRTIDEFLWGSFFPEGPESFRFSFYTLPLASTSTLGYAPGQYVRKGSTFATDKDERPVFVATTDFILKDSWIENDRLYVEKVEIFAPLKQEPEEAHMVAKFLIGEYEHGNLNIERCSQDPKFMSFLMHLIDQFLGCLQEQSCMSQSLNGIPTLLTPDEVKLILRAVDHEAKGAAHSVSQRFESTAMRERVFKAEHNAWWDATPLGPLTQLFAHSELNASMGEYVTPFSTLSYALSVFPRPRDRSKGWTPPLKTVPTATGVSNIQAFQQAVQKDDLLTAKHIFDGSDDVLKKRCGEYLDTLGEVRLVKLVETAGMDLGAWLFGILLVYYITSSTGIYEKFKSNGPFMRKTAGVIDLLRSPENFTHFLERMDPQLQLEVAAKSVEILLVNGIKHIDPLLSGFATATFLDPRVKHKAFDAVFVYMREHPSEEVIRYAKRVFVHFPFATKVSVFALAMSYSLNDPGKEHFFWFLARADHHDLESVKKKDNFSTMPRDFQVAVNTALKAAGTRARFEKASWNRMRFAIVVNSIHAHIPRRLFPILEDYAFEQNCPL